MKNKLVIGILAMAFLLCQGLAFAESAGNVTAVAEEAVVAGESANGTIGNAVAADELVTPAAEAVKVAANETKEEVKM